MAKPIAVLISDTHFTVPTLELATTAFKTAHAKAAHLHVPLVVAGDLMDSKAIIRAEVANRLLDLTAGVGHLVNGVLRNTSIYIMVGNHDRINEKGAEHSLEFLKPYAHIIDTPYFLDGVGYLIPYESDSEVLRGTVANTPKGSTLIMHTGVQSANMGHYIKDTSSLPKEVFADYRVISGHYHARQDIKCGRPRKGAVGLFSYVGNPYTLTFGEANDPEKGFQVLMDDGTLEFVPTNLRKHVIINEDVYNLNNPTFKAKQTNPGDLVWVKLSGSRSELDAWSKDLVGARFGIKDFKLDKIATDAVRLDEAKVAKMTGEQTFDAVIDVQADDLAHKAYLKQLWRKIL